MYNYIYIILMDTRFWGPDGWKLLHSITENYPDKPLNKEKELYKTFFLSLPYVLPCVYCRRSLHQYMKELPLVSENNDNLKSKNKLCLWLYRIHNKVNKKLRMQNLNNKKDPPYKEIRLFYRNYLKTINNNNCSDSPGWDFIYSIAFNFPIDKSQMQNERYKQHIKFLYSYSKIIPFKKVQVLFQEAIKKIDISQILMKRSIFKKNLYRIETFVKKQIKQKCLTYKLRCIELENYRANCKVKTCRKK